MRSNRLSIRTLVVEDNPGDAVLLQAALEKIADASFATTHVETLADALARLAAAKFDVVLLDLGLPDSCGPETLTRLLRYDPEVAVVVLTGLEDEDVGIKAVQQGAQDYLVKGRCPPALLGRSIRYSIERHHSALEALRDSEARLSALVNSALDAIITVDQQQRITLFNPAAERTFDYKASEVLGKTWERLVPERFRSASTRLFGQIDTHSWKPGRLERIYGQRCDGSEFPMETSISQVEVRGRKLSTAILRDISERLRAEQVMMTQFRLSAVAEERNRMAGEIHDTLAQGFAAILLHLDAVRDSLKTSPKDVPQHLERSEAIARASLAEARRSVWALCPPELDSDGLIGAVQNFLNRVASGSLTAIEFRPRGTPYPLPKETELELLRICQEAVNNALRHAKASEIQVQVAYEPALVEVCVHDNGRGIDAQALANGSGFGLKGMRARAERIGAQIEISGEPGRGTRVETRLPARFPVCEAP
jgi:PAS domain S-box-containing protein